MLALQTHSCCRVSKDKPILNKEKPIIFHIFLGFSSMKTLGLADFR